MHFLLEKVDSHCYVRVLEGSFVPYKLEIRKSIIDLKKLEGWKAICWVSRRNTPPKITSNIMEVWKMIFLSKNG